MKSLYESFVEYASHREVANPERKLLLEDPAKFFATQVGALTEDLTKKGTSGSRHWAINRILENQARFLYEGMFREDTTTGLPSGQSFTFTTMALPLVRKVLDTLIAMDLVSVQPINQPTAKIFYLDFQYHEAPAGGEAGDSIADVKDPAYSTSTESGPVKELDMKVTDETVTAIEKKLKAIWTMELEQDLMAYQGLNAENELMTVLQDQIRREVDGIIIADLIAGAAGSGTGTGTGAGNVNWSSAPLVGDTTSTYIRDYQKSIYNAIVQASNLIFKKRYQYATWIVGHPDAIARLEVLEDFRLTQEAAANTLTIGRHVIGTLGSRYTVYKDPFFPYTNKLLLGYKGTAWMDSCGFYAPYVPLYMTPKIVDPNDFTPRRGLMSRFAHGTLIKDGLATVTITAS
jgi:hypothetical protein